MLTVRFVHLRFGAHLTSQIVLKHTIATHYKDWASGGMVDTPDSKSCELYARVGSSPTSPTN